MLYIIEVTTRIMFPLYTNSVKWTSIPLPPHRGIIISSAVAKSFTIKQIKKKLLSIDHLNNFEEILPNVEMKFIETVGLDSLWLLRWKDGDQIFLALSFGSEL